MTERNPVLTFVRSLAFNALFYLNTVFWLIVGIPTFLLPYRTTVWVAKSWGRVNLVLLLMIAATVLSVSFATRGAMATNKPVIEVLHFVGARNAYIASHFQRHFWLLGLQGGAIGGGLAILLFAVAGYVSRWFSGTAGAEQTAALFGSFSIGLVGYVAILGQIVLIALVTALTSRQTVNRTLENID